MTGPPANTALEQALLGELLDHGPVDDVRAVLGDTGAAFHEPFHARVYSAVVDLHKAGRHIDANTVRAELNGHMVGGQQMLFTDLIGAGGLVRDAAPHAREVARLWRQRELLTALDLARERIDRDPDRTAAALAALAETTRATMPAHADEFSDWARIDLAGILAGDTTPEQPTLMVRTDGHGLLYRGKTHDIHGEPESGKSFLAQIEVVACVNAGLDVLYLDYETDETLVCSRLVQMGIDRDQAVAHLDYRRPESAARPTDPMFAEILNRQYVLAVIDGVTDAIGVSGAPDSRGDVNDQYAAWRRNLPDRIAKATGAAVLMIDHVTKDRESRGRYAIGGQAKLAGITGASYSIEVISELGQGLRGEVSLRVGKDRPGGVRPHAGITRPTDRTQEAARIVVDSTAAGITATIKGPELTVDGTPKPFHPTFLMEKISAFLVFNPDSYAKEIELGVKGKAEAKRSALADLVRAGYVVGVKAASRGGGQRYSNVCPFTQDLNPEQAYDGQEPLL